MSKFELGRLVATVRISERIEHDPEFNKFVWLSLGRYKKCDWGDMSADDKALNDEAVLKGDSRIMGAYICKLTKEKIWIITEADRSCTTVLFPDEY